MQIKIDSWANQHFPTAKVAVILNYNGWYVWRDETGWYVPTSPYPDEMSLEQVLDMVNERGYPF